nr:iron-containing alcohol dehydrogenase [Roseibium aquae]
MGAFTFNTSGRIVFEPGAAGELSRHAAPFLGARVLIVTDPGIVKAGLLEAPMTSLTDARHAVAVFDGVTADPLRSVLTAAVDQGRAFQPTSVVGLGGGSSLDVAKLVALLLGSGEDLDEAWGVGNAKGPRLPLVLVPTTAGTGSEVTPISIITVEDDEKRGVVSPVILPDLAVLDADLTLGLPAHVTAATGIDAMVHAIEGYASKSANNNPVSRTLAVEALKLLGANIRTAVDEPGNRDARGAMLLGSMLAGMAFANSPVAAVHALAYPIGGTFHVPHGLSNALVLPHVLKFNAAVAAGPYSSLAPQVFPALAEIEDPIERTEAFARQLQGLAADLGLETRLREVGIAAGDIPQMAKDAMKQTRLLINNPRDVTEADARMIYEAAL